MSLPKPQMRRLLQANIKRNLVGMVVASILGGYAFKVLYVDKEKQLYADFYKTYDAEAALKIMNDSGFMQSCPK